ncbi:MAG: urea transporter [Caldilineaceae bacterium]
MSTYLAPWNNLADRNVVIRFIDVNLRGSSQVMFQNNPLTGLLFLVGITWGALAAGMPNVAIGAVVGVVVATATAMLLAVHQDSLRMGLYGFNGILVGCALPTFLKGEPLMWVYLILGAAVSTVAMLAISSLLKPYGVSALTFPFVLTTWFLVLGAYAFARTPIASMGPPALPAAINPAAAVPPAGATFWLDSILQGPAQVFLIQSVITGIIFLIALAVSDIWAAIFALGGAVVAVLTALLLGADAKSLNDGLYGFSPVLTAIALGTTFYRPSWRVTLYTLLGVIFTVVIQGALNILLTPVGIPTFTAPFVFATWLFLFPKENLVPVQHAPMTGGLHLSDQKGAKAAGVPPVAAKPQTARAAKVK